MFDYIDQLLIKFLAQLLLIVQSVIVRFLRIVQFMTYFVVHKRNRYFVLGLIDFPYKDHKHLVNELIDINFIESHEILDKYSENMFIIAKDVLKYQFHHFKIDQAVEIHAHLVIVFTKKHTFDFMNY